MSGYVLCQVKRAEHPWYLESINLNIYSIEELCYLICNDLPLLDEHVWTEELADWLRHELKLRALGGRLSAMLQKDEVHLAELIFPVLKEINYLSQTELRGLEQKVKILESQPAPMRLKLKGDSLIGHGKYRSALDVYHQAMAYRENSNLGSQFTGSIYNNMGCAYARLFQMEEACLCFKEAYEQLHTGQATKSYLLSAYMKDGKDRFLSLAEELKLDERTLEEIKEEIRSMKVPGMPDDLETALSGWTREYHRSTGL